MLKFGPLYFKPLEKRTLNNRKIENGLQEDLYKLEKELQSDSKNLGLNEDLITTKKQFEKFTS